MKSFSKNNSDLTQNMNSNLSSFITQQPAKVYETAKTTNNYESVDYDPQNMNITFKFNPNGNTIKYF